MAMGMKEQGQSTVVRPVWPALYDVSEVLRSYTARRCDNDYRSRENARARKELVGAKVGICRVELSRLRLPSVIAAAGEGRAQRQPGTIELFCNDMAEEGR